MCTVSFEKKLLAVQDELLRFAYKLTASRDEAYDLLQETFLKALRNESKFTPDTNFRGWMCTIMRNIFINNYHKRIREQTIIGHTDKLYNLGSPQNSGLEGIESLYNTKEINRVISKLPPEYRIPISMYIAGFKYREIATRLDLLLGTVKSRIFFTRKRLQDELKDFL